MISFINIQFDGKFRSAEFFGQLDLPYKIHQLVECFQKDESSHVRILWRMETPSYSVPSILVQMNGEPNEERFAAKLLQLNVPAKCKIKPIQMEFEKGQKFLFKLRANPTKALFVEGKKNRKRIPLGIKTEANKDNPDLQRKELYDWLHAKAKIHGFSLLNCDFFKEDIGNIRSASQRQIHSSFNSVLFNGALQVEEPSLFLNTIYNGIGSAKGFGFGMLSIKRV